MALRGRKQKAEAAVVATTKKREKLANGGEGVEEATIVIEHCTTLSQALRLEALELPVKVNPAKPRRGSFKVTLLRPDRSSAELWTGIKKGPPCKLKFPEPQEVVEELKKYLL
uniref:Selenoprotein H n=1 Tax=Saimiri boliviensis boliviensis TaxID=39432 RepID=A0A2K6SIM0_SAIBB